MGKEAKERLSRALNDHLNTIHETFQILDQKAPSTVEKVSWKDVIQMGEQLSKQATMVGVLWTGETPEVKVLEENMASYFNILQGFLLISHGSSVRAGPTLSSCIHLSVKQVVDGSFTLLKEAISSYGSHSKTEKVPIPQLVGTVWEACSALKKTPSTNITAIGRAMTQVAVSMKDVLREMNELKPASSDISDEASAEASQVKENNPNDSDDSLCEDLGNDLSPEEMKIAELTTAVVSGTLGVVKELIRSITTLLKQEGVDAQTEFIDHMEKLLRSSQGLGIQIDELGACLYPPQEISSMKAALAKLSSILDETNVELENLKGSAEDISQACSNLKSSIKQLDSVLDSANEVSIESMLEALVVNK
ncbi:hypothetical protein Leryth_024551 [Lithospermum erythrorhizon]|nr:hypothetical protein Leryth_024551 [Lithospermum erythrorhizon]